MDKNKDWTDYYKHLQQMSERAAEELRRKARERLKPMRDSARSRFYDRYDDRTFNQVLLFMIDNMKEGLN